MILSNNHLNRGSASSKSRQEMFFVILAFDGRCACATAGEKDAVLHERIWTHDLARLIPTTLNLLILHTYHIYRIITWPHVSHHLNIRIPSNHLYFASLGSSHRLRTKRRFCSIKSCLKHRDQVVLNAWWFQIVPRNAWCRFLKWKEVHLHFWVFVWAAEL